MPGTVPQGSLNTVWIGTANPPTTKLDYMQGWEFGSEAETTKEEFYHDDAAITTVGEAVYDGTCSGKWADNGPALAIAFAASQSQDLVYMAYAPNGTDGIGVPGRISRFRNTGAGRKQAAGYSFNFVQDGAPFVIGAGLGA